MHISQGVKMWLQRTTFLLLLVSLANCEKTEDQDAASAFMEAARTLFTDRNAINSFQGMASAFIGSDAGKQMGNMLTGGKAGGDVGQIISGLGNLLSGDQGTNGDNSMLETVLESLASSGKSHQRSARDSGSKEQQGIDFQDILNFGSMFLGQNSNANVLMGLVPMLLENFNRGGETNEIRDTGKHDHSGHSWYLPPILENIHVMWDHFSTSELGQTLYHNSGLAKIVHQMSDQKGNIQYEKILDSFENPTLRRRWIKSLTNFVAEWISHISDPMIQQRYLSTIQFVGNSFLKTQGFQKSAMFDPTKPTESISRLANALSKRYLGIKIDSMQYIKPAIAYFQELLNLASEKGFIMSRINARELSNKLSDTINNDIVRPILKAYRAYKWSVKMPHCASQILCTINENSQEDDNPSHTRSFLTKISSYPAAWAVSNKLGMNFWSLYGAVTEQEGCIRKFPADCIAFHEEEILATTEFTHSEL